MQDRQLYAQILGIESPWRVDRVELAPDPQEVHIYLEHKADIAWKKRGRSPFATRHRRNGSCGRCARSVAVGAEAV